MNFFKLLAVILVPVVLSGCAGMGELSPPSTQTTKVPGLYHKIRPKETLWRVSKMYGVDLQTLARANKLADTQKIYAGQLLFIPQASVTDFGENAKERPFVWPLKGKVLSFYGSIKDGVKNKGIDINARHGEAVIAARSGKVSFIDENMKGFGKTLIIDHTDEFSTVYACNSQILVKVGQSVRQGTVIAKAGQSGRAASPRLHFEIRKKHEPQNPFYFLP
jgi:murein DD-endopeptidase MepM/ murein hydrolase activator NlpD